MLPVPYDRPALGNAMTEPGGDEAAPALLVSTSSSGVRRLRLNRPQARNAINWVLRRQLRSELEAAGLDDGVRVVVLSGDDRAFCAGGDVKEMGNGARDTSAKLSMAATINHLIAEMDKPVVAEVRGFASGAGFGLATACDFVLVDDTAVFQSAFISRGLVPDMGTTYWLARQVGLHRAKEIVLTGRSVDAAEAHALGIAARLWSSAEFRTEADAFAEALAASSVRAIGLTKRLLNRAFETDLATALDLERLSQLQASASDEHLTYLAALSAGGAASGAVRAE